MLPSSLCLSCPSPLGSLSRSLSFIFLRAFSLSLFFFLSLSFPGCCLPAHPCSPSLLNLLRSLSHSLYLHPSPSCPGPGRGASALLSPPPAFPCARREGEGEPFCAWSIQAEGGFCSHMELIRRESLRFSGSFFADDVILIKPRCFVFFEDQKNNKESK